jgi:hypothetical protein
MTRIVVGCRAQFTYSGQDEEELRKRNGWVATVERRLTRKENDLAETGPMYHLRFDDGYERDAFRDELTRIFLP